MAASNPQKNDTPSSETTPKLDPLARIHLSKANYELRQQEKKLNKQAIVDEAFVVGGRQKNQMKNRRGRLKSKARIANDECAFCREK
ncbi:hypothetical protein PIB30_063659 [Stylosanthes scabra]|uniref:Uncharacterized protein n=1 Tax=Stylosanthes scabra TaxID=79078 RepID=A0ABU6YJ08_9FABA|nr:hypothetical protein [Stylosanthes scabra]